MVCHALPVELWKMIMQHVPILDRFRYCSSVRRFTGLQQQLLSTYSLPHGQQLRRRTTTAWKLQRWIHSHGQPLTSLKLSYTAGQLTQLPCPGLRQLVLTSSGAVQLGPSSFDSSTSSTRSGPGVLEGCCAGLTKLQLQDCRILDETHSLGALTVLTLLQHLDLHALSTSSNPPAAAAPMQTRLELPAPVLQRLCRLTHLTLRGDSLALDKPSLQHISALSVLQELHISHGSLVLSRSQSPGMLRVSILTQLHLQRVTVNPLVLDSCTGLRVLQLQDLTLMHIAGGDGVPITQGGELLLATIGRMRCLERLQLSHVSAVWPDPAPPGAPSSYASLSASTRLQHLEMRQCALPAKVWRDVFRRSACFPSLQTCLLCWRAEDWLTQEEDTNPTQPISTPAAALDRDDALSLTRGCPALTTLHIHAVRHATLVELTGLRKLAALHVDGIDGCSLESLASLSGLSALRDLELVITAPMSYRSMVALAALTRLSLLRLELDRGLDYKDAYNVDSLFESNGQPPDAWLQVLLHTSSDKRFAHASVSCLGKQILHNQQHTADCLAQLAEQQRCQAELQQEVGRQNRQLRVHQQREAEQQSQVAGLQMQVVAQLQQLHSQQERLDAAQRQIAAQHAEVAAATSDGLATRLGVVEAQLQQLLAAMQCMQQPG